MLRQARGQAITVDILTLLWKNPVRGERAGNAEGAPAMQKAGRRSCCWRTRCWEIPNSQAGGELPNKNHRLKLSVSDH